MRLVERYSFQKSDKQCFLVGVEPAGPLLTEGEIEDLKKELGRLLSPFGGRVELLALYGVAPEQAEVVATAMVAEFNCSVATSPSERKVFTICKATDPFVLGETFPIPPPEEALPATY